MFTGIVQSVGRIQARQIQGDGLRMDLQTGTLSTAGWRIGDSIADGDNLNPVRIL